MTQLWVLTVSQMAIFAAYGEIAIRYAAWSALLYRSRQRIEATPMVVGIALLAFGYLVFAARWMTLMADPHNAARFYSITEGDVVSELARLIVFLALCFLSYPAVHLRYRQSRERIVVELTVRIFLIVFSALAGWVLCTLYYFHS